MNGVLKEDTLRSAALSYVYIPASCSTKLNVLGWGFLLTVKNVIYDRKNYNLCKVAYMIIKFT